MDLEESNGTDVTIDEFAGDLASTIPVGGTAVNNARHQKQPEIPKNIFELHKLVQEMTDVFSGVRVHESPFIPRGQVWFTDDIGRIKRIIEFGNTLNDADAISLCVGEMR